MVDNSFLHGAGGTRPVSGPGPADVGSVSKSKSAGTEATGAAFKALLEKLETQARDLAQASEGVEGPAELAGAVDTARSSLEDALSLSDRLLEAYRATQHGADSTGLGPDVTDGTDDGRDAGR